MDELSGKIAKDYVIEISKFHRIVATPYFHDAVLYVKGELEKIGLDEVAIEQFLADGKTKAWTHETRISWRINDGELWMVEPRREALARYKEMATSVIGHSKKADVVAEVIDVGEGREEDYGGKDVKGKIALVATEWVRGEIHDTAVKHGAIGIIAYPPFYRAVGYPDAIMHLAFHPSSENRDIVTFGFAISARQANMLKSLIRDGKMVKVHAKIDAELYDDTMDVLTAQFTGTEKPEEEVVLIAHLCHFRTCANDNASGSGTIMEIARAMKSLMDQGKISRPKRTIRFLWVPEVIGTIFWMHRYPNKVKNQLVALNLDMVGEHPIYCGRPLNLIQVPDSVPNYLNDQLAYLFEYVADHPKGVEPLEGWRFGMNYRLEKYCNGSDHEIFADSFFGIPAILFYNPDQFHHMSPDTADKVDTTRLQKVGVIAGAAALTIANADEATALALASLTHSRGYARVGDTASKIVEKLLSIGVCKSKDLALKLGTAYVRGLKKVEIAAEREAKNVLSAQTLGESEVIKGMAEGLKGLSESEKAKIEGVYKILCERLGLRPMEEEMCEDALETMRLVPRKEFDGPNPSLDKLWAGGGRKKIKSREDREWYAEFRRVHNPHKNWTLLLDGPAEEFMNFVDDKRSVYDICMLVSTEYRAIKPAEVKRFFDMCQDIGWISYSKKVRKCTQHQARYN